jgi:hypothetical protein
MSLLSVVYIIIAYASDIVWRQLFGGKVYNLAIRIHLFFVWISSYYVRTIQKISISTSTCRLLVHEIFKAIQLHRILVSINETELRNKN